MNVGASLWTMKPTRLIVPSVQKSQCSFAPRGASTKPLLASPALIAPAGPHSMGGKYRARRRSVAWFCLCPHSRQMAPTCLIGLSFDISFSRTPREVKPLALDICYTNKRRGEGIVFSLNPQQSWAEHSEGNRPILGRSAALCWFERLAALQATCLAA